MTGKRGGKRTPAGGRPANPHPTRLVAIVCSDEDKETILQRTSPTQRAAILLAAIKAADAASPAKRERS